MNVRLFHPSTLPDERCAWLSLVPATKHGQSLIKLVTGSDWSALTSSKVFGPYLSADAETRFAKLLAQLKSAGYAEFYANSALDELNSGIRKLRARAALKLGFKRDKTAVPALLATAAIASAELPTIVDALGRIRDPRAIPLARECVEKKLLSRRRSGVEALRNLQDSEGLQRARTLGEARLPPALLQCLQALDEASEAAAPRATLGAALAALEPSKRGIAIDQLYEFATPLCVAAVRAALREDFTEAHLWRYAKSVLKRSMLRGDAQTFAEIALCIERKAGVAPGSFAVVKSGLDGESRNTPIFRKRTQRYLARANARYLRRLQESDPALYLKIATALLIGYRNDDARMPKGKVAPFGHALMLFELLHARSPRFARISWRAAVGFVSADAVRAAWQPSHVPNLELWEQQPRHYLTLAAFAELAEVRAFALAGVARHPQIWQQASNAELVALFAANELSLSESSRTEVLRRFDPLQPDLGLWGALLDGGDAARACARELLRKSVWLTRASEVVELLLRASEAGRAAGAEAVLEAAAAASPAQRRELCSALLATLDRQEVIEGELQGAIVSVLSALAADCVLDTTLDTILSLIEATDFARREVGGVLLGLHPDALSVLGSARLVVLADSPVLSVRAAACRLVARALPQFAVDPYPLILLAESRYPDCRTAAFMLLEQLDPASLEIAAVLALADSNQTPVQAFARDWIKKRLPSFDMLELLLKLSEHPHRTMRAFAFELAEQASPPGVTAFKILERFFVSSLLTPGLPRSTKARLLSVVEQRAGQDSKQAAIAASILNASLRTATQRDFEAILLVLTRLQLQHPQVASDWLLRDPEAQAC